MQFNGWEIIGLDSQYGLTFYNDKNIYFQLLSVNLQAQEQFGSIVVVMQNELQIVSLQDFNDKTQTYLDPFDSLSVI